MPRWWGRSTAAVAFALFALVPACDPGTVDLAFRPEVGAVYRYRYEIVAEVTSQLAGEDEQRHTDRSVLDATMRVLDVDDDAVRAEVTVERDGQPSRSLVVRFDRGDQLSSVDVVEGVPIGSLGDLDLADLLPAIAPPADRRVAPGDSWSTVRSGAAGPRRARGTARLDRLSVEDDREVAQVVSELSIPIDEEIGDGGRLVGEQDTSGTAVYDLADGSLRRSTARTSGEAALTVQPPLGIVSSAVEGSLRYAVVVTTRRLR